MFDIGMSSCDFEINDKNLYDMKQSGMSFLEISLHSDKCDSFDYSNAKKLADKYGVTLWSYHLPFLPFSKIDISSADPQIRSFSTKYLSELIKKGADIGISKFIVHPSGEPIANEERGERLNYSMQSLNTLAEIADRCAATVCVEDLPRSCLGNNISDMKKLLSANDKLRVCFDVNHLLSDAHTDFIAALGDKIVTTHISDYDFIDEKHWFPGEGKIDWFELVNSLKGVNYSGVWMFELGFGDTKTIKRNKTLTFNDFYNNAIAIFEGKTPECFKIV